MAAEKSPGDGPSVPKTEHQVDEEPNSDVDSVDEDWLDPISSYSTYANYIHAMVGTSYNYGLRYEEGLTWLDYFFNGVNNSVLPAPALVPDVTDTFVLHTKDGRLHRYTANNVDRLAQILRPRPMLAEVHTRIIVFSYRHTWTMDRSIVDLLAIKFKISPLHLYRILYNEQSWNEDSRPIPGATKRSQLGWFDNPAGVIFPSNKIIEVRTAYGTTTISALEIDESGSSEAPNKTLLVFCRGIRELKTRRLDLGRYYRFQVASQGLMGIKDYLQMMQSLDESAIRAADKSPMDFLLPFARSFAFNFGKYFDQQGQLRIFSDRTDMLEPRRRPGDPSLDNEWPRFQPQFQSFSYCRASIKMIPQSPARDEVEADYAHLEQLFTRAHAQLRDRVQRRDMALSLKVSEQSIEESKSVRRLTQLAFVFIPMSFVTSCFGMNLEILDSGTVKFSTFLITAASITLGVIVLSSQYTYRLLLHARKLLSGLLNLVKAMAKLAIFSPISAFWMFCFGLRHPNHLSYALDATNVDAKLLGIGQANEQFHDMARFPRYPISRFWRHKGGEIFSLFEGPDWEDRSLWRRMRERWRDVWAGNGSDASSSRSSSASSSTSSPATA